ncbi:MAG: hypothetical protein K2R98_03410 [Gemmataceae bacterium]|nr:hypothetical protein [Gemmataceae bacterium]
MSVCLLCLCLSDVSLGQLPPPRIMPAEVPYMTPVPTVIEPVRPITLAEFAASFRPAPGTYQVVFLNPVTKCATPVTFTLPPGCPKVCVSRREITFDYGKCEVHVRFRICTGKVVIIND